MDLRVGVKTVAHGGTVVGPLKNLDQFERAPFDLCSSMFAGHFPVRIDAIQTGPMHAPRDAVEETRSVWIDEEIANVTLDMWRLQLDKSAATTKSGCRKMRDFRGLQLFRPESLLTRAVFGINRSRLSFASKRALSEFGWASLQAEIATLQFPFHEWIAAMSAATRTLSRSRDDRVLAGVMGGIARRFGWNSTLVRVVFVVVSVLSAAFPGIIVYLAMWLLIPQE